MLTRFLQSIEKEKLLLPGDRVLLAVSGGVDSVVLLHLFMESGFDFGVAHINHKLRGAESDEDARFVAELAAASGKKFFGHTIDDLDSQIAKGESLQSAARRIRYAFLEKTVSENNFDCIATAHHLDDNLETVLINLLRGSGVSGLRGMLPKQHGIIRPLLFANRKEIEAYAGKEKLHWRHDSSNDSDDYTRNRLRHQVIPSLKEMQPGLEKVLGQMTDRLRQTELLLQAAADEYRKTCTEETATGTVIDAQKLAALPAPETLLHLWLRDKNFHAVQLADALQTALAGESGASFFSSTHRLLCDRGKIHVLEISEPFAAELLIEKHGNLPGIHIDDFTGDGETKKSASPFSEFFDSGALSFPLLLRPWRPGDRFIPLGMKQHKKISDFLVDQKVPLHEKEKTLVLESGGEIAWVVGHRISESFKIKPGSRSVTRISMNTAEIFPGTKS
ncbi:MAG: tRNA(Ile)-lysidine synthase [Bacteroidetes bacterium]|nr:MAG: tRNA(Ile)-lysidine synthase [Bacteroidota bacterium]